MNEIYLYWEPLPGLGKKYHLSALTSTLNDGFKIRLTDYDEANPHVEIFFNKGIAAYRDTNAMYRAQLFKELTENYESYKPEWTFFKVTNSSYAQWLSDACLGARSSQSFFHFCFITKNRIIDALANYEPLVRFTE